MTACVQRVLRASVEIGGEIYSEIKKGLLILVGAEAGDDGSDAELLAEKCAGLRIFDDADGKMNLSVSDVCGEILTVTNFTLLGDCSRGKRPSFSNAERPERARELTERFEACLKASGVPVKTGVFGADMRVSLVNDGPVTLLLDTKKMKTRRAE